MGIFSKLFGRRKSKPVKPKIVKPKQKPQSPGCIEPGKWPASKHIDDK
jgi:hypothetical protein